METVMRKKHSDIDLRSKIWIEVGGEAVFGRGRRVLLEAVEKHGSITQAAKKINISNRRAWSYIRNMEERLGIQLVVRQASGKNGRGAVLTPAARDFLDNYRHLELGINEFVAQRIRTSFSGDRHG
jgi:molybdate transport system regulatory protein